MKYFLLTVAIFVFIFIEIIISRKNSKKLIEEKKEFNNSLGNHVESVFIIYQESINYRESQEKKLKEVIANGEKIDKLLAEGKTANKIRFHEIINEINLINGV